MSKKTDYAKAIKEALANKNADIMVTVSGVEFPVKQPPAFVLAKTIQKLQQDGADDITLSVATVKLCLPDGLDDETVFDLIVAGNYLDENSVFRKAVDQQCAAVFDAFDIGESEEGDADFGAPGQQESA